MPANDRQVGGAHYDSSYKHWDFAIRTSLGWCEGCITKHLARWDKKGVPLMDVEKALHYTEKLIEEAHICVLRPRPPLAWLDAEVTKFISANKILDEAATAVRLATMWTCMPQLYGVRGSIEHLLERISGSDLSGYMPKAQPVPLEDSNKHAPRDRAGDAQS